MNKSRKKSRIIKKNKSKRRRLGGKTPVPLMVMQHFKRLLLIKNAFRELNVSGWEYDGDDFTPENKITYIYRPLPSRYGMFKSITHRFRQRVTPTLLSNLQTYINENKNTTDIIKITNTKDTISFEFITPPTSKSKQKSFEMFITDDYGLRDPERV